MAKRMTHVEKDEYICQLRKELAKSYVSNRELSTEVRRLRNQVDVLHHQLNEREREVSLITTKAEAMARAKAAAVKLGRSVKIEPVPGGYELRL